MFALMLCLEHIYWSNRNSHLILGLVMIKYKTKESGLLPLFEHTNHALGSNELAKDGINISPSALPHTFSRCH